MCLCIGCRSWLQYLLCPAFDQVVDCAADWLILHTRTGERLYLQVRRRESFVNQCMSTLSTLHLTPAMHLTP
jgi:hypothetical protein